MDFKSAPGVRLSGWTFWTLWGLRTNSVQSPSRTPYGLCLSPWTMYARKSAPESGTGFVRSPYGVQKVHPDRWTPGADLKSMDSGGVRRKSVRSLYGLWIKYKYYTDKNTNNYNHEIFFAVHLQTGVQSCLGSLQRQCKLAHNFKPVNQVRRKFKSCANGLNAY